MATAVILDSIGIYNVDTVMECNFNITESEWYKQVQKLLLSSHLTFKLSNVAQTEWICIPTYCLLNHYKTNLP